jgi:hypothetical protein
MIRPSIEPALGRVLPQAEACFDVTPTRGPTRSAFTVSHRPDGFRHPRTSQACCILQPIMGFTGFKTCPARAHAVSASLPMPCPPEPSPPSQRFRSSPTSPAPLPLSGSCDPPRLRGLVPRRSPLRYADVAASPRPLLSWASLPKHIDAAPHKATPRSDSVRTWSVAPHGCTMPRHRSMLPPDPAWSFQHHSPKGALLSRPLGLPPCPHASRHLTG